MYSLDVPGKPARDKIREKGIKRSYIRQNVHHRQSLHTLRTLTATKSKFRAFRCRRHAVEMIKVSKTGLNAFDGKRYILGDGMRTLAYRHKDTAIAADDSEQRVE